MTLMGSSRARRQTVANISQDCGIPRQAFQEPDLLIGDIPSFCSVHLVGLYPRALNEPEKHSPDKNKIITVLIFGVLFTIKGMKNNGY